MIRETDFRRAHRQLMWESQESLPTPTEEGYEASTITDTSSPIQSTVHGSAGDDRPLRGKSEHAGMSATEEWRWDDEMPDTHRKGGRRSGPLRLRSVGTKSHRD